jgi:hypothetical protein
MFSTALGYLDNSLICGAIGLVVGIIFSQKIKDFVTGVPSGFRTAMANVETQAKADISAAIADVFSKITPVTAKPPAPPAVPVAPVVVAPVVAVPAGGPAPAQPASNVVPHP